MFSSLSVWTPAFPAGHVTATDLLTCKDWRIAGVVPIAVTLRADESPNDFGKNH
ncbi:hypothetical protein ACU63K_13255 [Klebsiella aerogenes]